MVRSSILFASFTRYRDIIEEVSDERGAGDGIFVYLKPGFYVDDPGSHIVHEDSVTACARELRYVKPCGCNDCYLLVCGKDLGKGVICGHTPTHPWHDVKGRRGRNYGRHPFEARRRRSRS